MLRLPKKTALAIEAVLDVAFNARPDPVQSKEITKRQGIPHRYLEQVLQQLVHDGILKGVRGPRGGYTLARERRRITMGDVVRVVQGIDEEAMDDVTGSDLGRIVVRPSLEEIGTAMMERLDAITFEDLCRTAEKTGVKGDSPRRSDFTI